MTDANLNAAHLREQVLGHAEGSDRVAPHAALVDLDLDRAALDFVDDVVRPTGPAHRFDDTALGSALHKRLHTSAATTAVRDGRPELLAYLTGVNEQIVGADSVTVLSRLQEAIQNNGAPLHLVMGGLPETGKTNTVHLLGRLWSAMHPDGVLVTNARSLAHADRVVTSDTELLRTLVDPDVLDRPTLFVLDEASTHLDATRNGHEARTKWGPLTKRFAKLSVDAMVIGHTLTDVSPEALRVGTLFGFKSSKQRAEWYGSLDPSTRDFTDPLFVTDPIEEFPARWYDPDDWSPWTWDLDTEVLELDDVDAIRSYLS